ncbi:MAG: hypothetical protein V4754_14500 [Pseudomonadota bacterium]
MKRSIKAALLSAVVFPGAGHVFLGRGRRACLFLAPAAVAAMYMVSQVYARAAAIVDQVMSGTLAPDLELIMARVSAAPGDEGPLLNVAVCVLLACWVGAIVDCFLIGRAPVR